MPTAATDFAMKAFTVSALALLMALPAARAQGQRFQQEAYLVIDANTAQRVWIGDANKTEFLYFETEQGVSSQKMRNSKPQAIWLMEPAAYTEAVELFQGRKYEEALAKFREVRETYKKLIELPDNHSSLAAFYEMECLRKLQRLDDLAKAQESFLPDDRDSLTRPHQLTQLELYAMWDAVRTKDWSRLETICNGRLEDNKLPGYQRAQIGYCLGLALEGQDKPLDAINAFNIAMTADSGASEVVTRDAALRSLRLYAADEELQRAMKLHGTDREKAGSTGARRLGQAAALADLFQLSLGDGMALPAEFEALLKFKGDAAE